MHMVIPPGHLVNAAGAALFVVLGLWVATVRPRTGPSKALSAFAVSFGVAFLFQNLLDPSFSQGLNDGFMLLSAAGAVAALASLFALARVFPLPFAPEDRRPALAVGALGLLIVAGIAAAGLMDSRPSVPHVSQTTLTVTIVAMSGLIAGMWAVVVLLAARFRRWRGEPGPARRQAALMALALVMFPAFIAGIYVMDSSWAFRAAAAGGLVMIVLTAFSWLRCASLPDGAAARRVGLLTLGAPLLGLSLGVLAGSWQAVDSYGLFGAARAVSILLFTYAILRHQLLGLDVKVRWTISKTTVAAAFIAAFFLASEGTQLAFGQENPWLGLVAAGALVFAIAPLQRFADRVAIHAVPLGPDASAPAAAAGAIDSYRWAVRKALSDGFLSDDDEAALARLADSLGVGSAEALRVRREEAASRATAARKRRPADRRP